LLGAGIPIKDWGVVGFTWYGFEYQYVLEQPGPDDQMVFDEASVYTLTLAGEPLEDLYVGANLNVLRQSISGQTETAVWPDIGIIKIFLLPGKATVRHRVLIGSSLANLTYSKIDVPVGREDLPVAFRIGGSYSISYAHRSWMNRARIVTFLFHAEYRDLLNLNYGNGPRIGGELTLLEMISARAGYYVEDTGDYADDIGLNRIERSTFGMGLALPIYRFTGGSVPLRATLDWADVEVQSYLIESGSPDTYSSWTVAVDWYY
jgi:hypothetical protein